MKNLTRHCLPAVLLLGLAACGGADNADLAEGRKVDASGKEATGLVEKQRDIGMDLVPDHVAGALETKFPAWHPDRIIESDQGDGVIIYEFFGVDDAGEATKIEIRWADGRAELLIDEWLH
ncbi:MAG: hypothetical protein OEW64_09330 [Gammaproteobacteria bacterium]|nr:hypothetical protein [Gammaproteobacteria bacterium]MDH5304284.1 hypothetical protein [Gammaproteobacteria bacterium]MDH5321550.1 hypothetical protein [Gammaproteobacteria bacterium]